MAKQSKVVLVGTMVKLRRSSGFHNPIGQVRQVSGRWGYSASPTNVWMPATCKATAILGCVHSWQAWVGLPPGHLDY